MREYVYATDEREGHWLTGEQIVRCRDCKHAAVFAHSPGNVYCSQRCHLYTVEPDGFCSWGEAKTKEVQR